MLHCRAGDLLHLAGILAARYCHPGNYSAGVGAEYGKAQWNYVQTGLENAESYSMADDALKEGDTVIVTGNVNLAHEAPVKVVDR